MNLDRLALRGLELRGQIAQLEAELAEVNKELTDMFHDTGFSYPTSLGTVIVTATTVDRPSGKFDLKFNQDNFIALPDDNQLRLDCLAQGIVNIKPGVIKGKPSCVQYHLGKVGTVDEIAEARAKTKRKAA